MKIARAVHDIHFLLGNGEPTIPLFGSKNFADFAGKTLSCERLRPLFRR
jgi:hypothetical protein